MSCKTLQCVNIFNYFAFYIFGAIFLSLVTYLYVRGRPLYSFPNTDSKVDKFLKCLLVALGCYTLTFHGWCQTPIIPCHTKRFSPKALSLVVSFSLMTGLAALLIYSSVHMWHLLTFCFVGAGVVGLLLAFVLMFRRDSALKKKNDDFKRMEEGSYTQEANEEKKI